MVLLCDNICTGAQAPILLPCYCQWWFLLPAFSLEALYRPTSSGGFSYFATTVHSAVFFYTDSKLVRCCSVSPFPRFPFLIFHFPLLEWPHLQVLGDLHVLQQWISLQSTRGVFQRNQNESRYAHETRITLLKLIDMTPYRHCTIAKE